jgi:hypothetical protein
MPTGPVGVYSTLERPKAKRKETPSRLVPCSEGHGDIGQVFGAVGEWFGACEVCGECPKD